MKVLKQAEKLAELRARTDRQLIEVVDIHLNRGFDYIRLMAEADSRGHTEVAERFGNLASLECAEAERLQRILEAAAKPSHSAGRLCELRAYLSCYNVRSACA